MFKKHSTQATISNYAWASISNVVGRSTQ